MVERANKTISTALAKYVTDDEKRWDEHLPGILLALRTTFQSSAKFTPFYLTYGREAQLPIDVEYPSGPRESATVEGRISNILLKLDPDRAQALINIESAQEKQKKNYDSRVAQPKQWKIGDKVWKHVTKLQHSHSAKFKPKWEGPYRIHEAPGFGVYKLRDSEGRVEAKPIHGDRLKAYKEREVEPVVLIPPAPPPTEDQPTIAPISTRTRHQPKRNVSSKQRRPTSVAQRSSPVGRPRRTGQH